MIWTATAVATFAAVFLLYDLGVSVSALRRMLGGTRGVLARRLAGALLLGGVPLTVALFAFPGRIGELGIAGPVPLWSAAAGLALCPVAALAARIPAVRRAYPAVPEPHWSRRLWLANAAGWAAYLAAYEFCFRGFLLLSLARVLSPAAAVAVTTTLYAFAHLRRGPAEVAASAVFGVPVGLLTLATGSILPAFVAHLVMAVSLDTFCLLFRPDRDLSLWGHPAKPR